MSKHEEKLERKSPAKPEIENGSGALDEKELEKVTAGQISIPYEHIEFKCKEQQQ